MATAPGRKTATRSAASRGATPLRPRTRELAAQSTQEAILRAATRIFAKHGYDGGRIEQISQAAKSHDRMIYYYFGSKEGLFIAVIEDTYRRFNDAEMQVELKNEDPVEDLEALVRFMWDYYRTHPEFITLLNTENLHRGKHISKSLRAREYSSPALSLMGKVLEEGAARGTFRPGLKARDVYLMSAALAYFYLSNRYTLSAFFGEDLESAQAMAYWEDYITQAVVKQVMADGEAVRLPERKAGNARG